MRVLLSRAIAVFSVTPATSSGHSPRLYSEVAEVAESVGQMPESQILVPVAGFEPATRRL